MDGFTSPTLFGRFVDRCQQLVGVIEDNRDWRSPFRRLIDAPFREFSEPERAVAQTILLNVFTRAVQRQHEGRFVVPHEAALLLANGALRDGFLYLLQMIDSVAHRQGNDDHHAGEADPRLRPGLTYLRRRYADPGLSLADTARQSNLSKWHFGRVLKEVTGASFRYHLIEIRMVKARELLENTALEVKEVAGKVGYKHLSHFSRHFKRRTGVSASEYRKRSCGSGKRNRR